MNILNAGVDSAKHDIQELVEGLQAERSQALAGLRNLQLATRLLAQAEALRLAQRNPADVRLAPLAALDKITRERIAVLDVEVEVAAIRVPPVRKTEALVHGRITDELRRAVTRVSVVLTTDNGKPAPGVAPVEADDAGYYAFVISPAAADAIGTDTRLALAVRHDDAEFRPQGVTGFTLARGRASVQDVSLNEDALAKLKLRMGSKPSTVRAAKARTASGGTAANKRPATPKTEPKPKPS